MSPLRALLLTGALLAGALLTGCTSVVWHGHDPTRQQRLRIVEGPCGQHLERGETEDPTFDAIAADGLRFTADGRLIYPALTGDGWAIVRDGVPGRAWRSLGPLHLDPRGAPIYAAEDADGWRVIGPDGPGPTVPALRGPLRLDPRGRPIYVAQHPEGERVYVDHQPSAPFEAVRQLRLDPQSGRLAILGRRDGEDVVEVDGVERGRFAEAADVQLDAFRLAVLARRDGRWHVWLDGTWSSGHQAISQVHFAGARVLWATRDPDGDRVVVDGEPGPPYARVRMAEMRLSPAGPAYIARQHAAERTSTGRLEPWVLAIDGVTTLGARELGSLVRAPSGHWAIAAERDDGVHLVRDGAWGPAFREVGLPALSPDGAHLAALVDAGDGPGLLFDGHFTPAPHALDGTVVIAADGRRAACVERGPEGRWAFVFSDGSRRPLDVDELIAALSATPPAQRPLHLDERGRLRAWVAAELARPAP